jgi:tubulin monoglycylase TTLL3/8
VENPDHDSGNFDLKWSIKCSELGHAELWASQVVNGFVRCGCLTTKVGLTRTLRELAWCDSANADTFFPRWDAGRRAVAGRLRG